MSKTINNKETRLTTSERALLGLLSLGAMSGYDLRQLIPQSIGHFWNESYGQIYPALKRMHSDGLLEKQTQSAEGKPDRHIYSLTRKGMQELRLWLTMPVQLKATPRNELLLKVFFGAEVEPAVVRKHVETMRDEAEQDRARYAAIVRGLKKNSAGDPHLPYWLMTLNMGRHDTNARIAWCRETLEELQVVRHGGRDDA